MEDIEVPSFFLCPISLQIMRDPVIVPTGITYDRESIEKWLFSGKNDTCPVTKQVISGCEVTPNHTLRRLIQSWCTLNASYGIERIPTPKPAINKIQVSKILSAAKSPQQQVDCLRKLRSIANENETNKRCMEAAGAVDFLVSVVNNFNSLSFEEASEDGFEITRSPGDEALSILYGLQISESGLKNLIMGRNGELIIETLTKVMQGGNDESRAYAVLLLKSLLEVADPQKLISLKHELFSEIVQVLSDQISHKASQATLELLIILCPWGRNRIKAIEANTVSIMIDLLLDSPERRTCEMVLMVLDLLCQCAEGRAELLGHGAGLAVVSKKILRVSQVASERALRIIFSISKNSTTTSVLQDMLQIGIVAKLCLVLQVDCGSKTKDKAREVLKLHARVWKSSPCIPANLLSSYPA
ncbi:hypothetical protein SADUNF_Sadunf06G0158800 [Salix dunnii]|uniref:U-box domain-containing protein n=1 Tax=Salix dunnii TaxID=1413687 RepID=A0A835MVU9_9ROSI|nr:hypothetical protein SADUNF_Sadunf06G0158800 [Salix dunnii]